MINAFCMIISPRHSFTKALINTKAFGIYNFLHMFLKIIVLLMQPKSLLSISTSYLDALIIALFLSEKIGIQTFSLK